MPKPLGPKPKPIKEGAWWYAPTGGDDFRRIRTGTGREGYNAAKRIITKQRKNTKAAEKRRQTSRAKNRKKAASDRKAVWSGGLKKW